MPPWHRRLPVLLLGLGLLSFGAVVAPLLATRAPAATQPTDPDLEALPAGAVARLGSLRFRHGNQIASVALSSDGKLVATGGGYGIPKQVGRHGWQTHSDQRLCLWEAATGKLVREIKAPTGMVSGLAFSADGKTLAVGCGGGKLCFCDVDTGTFGPTFAGHGRQIASVRYLAHDKKVAVVSADGNVGLFAVGSGERLGEWKPFAGEPPLLARGFPAEQLQASDLSPDGTVVAFLYSRYEMDPTGQWPEEQNGLLRVFDAASGKQIAVTDQLPTGTRSLAFAPDGKTLVTVGAGIHFWDTVTWTKVRELSVEPRQNGNTLLFSPDGKLLALTDGNSDTLNVWDVARGKEIYKIPVERSVGMFFGTGRPPLAFSADGKRLAAGPVGRVRVWDAATGKEMAGLAGHRSSVNSLSYSSDGRELSSRCSNLLCRWDAATGKETGRVELSAPGTPKLDRVLDISPDGKTCACQAAGTVPELRDPATGKVLAPLEWDGKQEAQRGLFSADNRRLFLLTPTPQADDKSEARFFDVRTGKVVGRLIVPRWLSAHTLSADGKTFVWAGENGVLNVADVATGKVLHSLGKEDRSRSVHETQTALSPDGEFVAWSVGPANGANDDESTCPVRVFHVKTGRLVGTWLVPRLDNGSDKVVGLAFAPDGHCLATVQEGETAVRVWEIRSGQERRRFVGHKDWALSVAFAPDGTRLASGGKDGTVLVWDLRGPKKGATTDKELAVAWDGLAAADGAQADRAIGALVTAPEPGVGLLRTRLQPVAAAEPARVARLIADLDNDDFARRDGAAAALEALEGPVAPALRAALRGDPSAEARRRLEAVLERLATDEAVPGGQGLRRLRAIEVLERINSPAARDLLKALSEGAPAARSTGEAKAALARSAARG